MGHLIVLTTPDLEPGYRLAGVATRSLDSAREAAEVVDELLARPSEGDVIAVHEPFFNELPGVLRRRIDLLASPLVVALPGGEGADAEVERRAQHLRILWEAVGYQITFDRQGDST
jgi:vacuolar-type H+-ATPase subunit F/Vma7